MPLHVTWDNDEKTIIRCESEGHWTWDEYHAALNDIVEMMNGVAHRVDLVNVERPGAKMPSGSPQPHFSRATKVLPPNLGINCVVVKSVLGRAMSMLISRMPNNSMGSIKMVGSEEEAYAAIAKDRAKSEAV